MTVTIQKPAPSTVEIRREFLLHAAELYGTTLSSDDLDRLDHLADREALAGAFPWQSDAERSEALWALGEVMNDREAPDG